MCTMCAYSQGIQTAQRRASIFASDYVPSIRLRISNRQEETRVLCHAGLLERETQVSTT